MFEIYRRDQGTFEEQTKKSKRMATVDLRVDYLALGAAMSYGHSRSIRMGRKGRLHHADDVGQ